MAGSLLKVMDAELTEIRNELAMLTEEFENM